MALVGIQALSYRSSSCRIFYVFQKINLQNFSVTWNKINNSSDLLISYPSITWTQIKYMLPTSFKFRVNSHIKTVLSKTRENSRLKTRYLKGITIEQLFIISIARDHPQSSYIQLLKTRHSFILFFIFKITPYYIYISKMNFYFVFLYYASFYDFSKYIEKSKIVKLKRERNTQLDTWGMLLPQARCCCGLS